MQSSSLVTLRFLRSSRLTAPALEPMLTLAGESLFCRSESCFCHVHLWPETNVARHPDSMQQLASPCHAQPSQGCLLCRKARVCFTDEHYIATLLSIHNLEAETGCRDSLIYWEGEFRPFDGAHAYVWTPQEYNRSK